jgi:hypothetical protein
LINGPKIFKSICCIPMPTCCKTLCQLAPTLAGSLVMFTADVIQNGTVHSEPSLFCQSGPYAKTVPKDSSHVRERVTIFIATSRPCLRPYYPPTQKCAGFWTPSKRQRKKSAMLRAAFLSRLRKLPHPGQNFNPLTVH